MSDFTLDDLAALPKPEIIEEISYEPLLNARKEKIVELAPSYGLTYDVETLETDPAMIISQSGTYREAVLRARGNDIARSAYLYFARGAALEHLAAFYDVVRMAGESDDRLKRRVVLAVKGRSTAGTKPRYQFYAMSSSIEVEDAEVYTVERSPILYAAVLSTSLDGVAEAPLLETVRAAIEDPEVRGVNDTFVVRSAVIEVAPVTVAMTLLPNTDASIVATLAAQLPAAWAEQGKLGRDLTLDWIRAYLMVPGVHSVQISEPANDIVMQPFEAVRIGAVDLTIAGREF
ncbi:MAG: hypothetical protein EA385_15025 [Salinarimonadaceae bacterium]|nr:MAG: hypothetical protein EA385_15025 [Salinarimonadaceae bacterium]